MALIHGAIHSVTWTRSTQEHVNATRQLNSLLCKKTASERFASLFWGCFDPQRSTIQYINAGHLPPMLIRKTADGLDIRRLEMGGPVVGLLPDARYQQGEEFVAPGDLLIAFSDGIVEATNASGEDFGEQRLISAVRQLRDASPMDIRNAIHSRLNEFTGESRVDDDRTLVVVRFRHSAIEMSETRSSAASTV
jgi:sigma-B regulation protein RsbU (phosphoserine phosphatase)